MRSRDRRAISGAISAREYSRGGLRSDEIGTVARGGRGTVSARPMPYDSFGGRDRCDYFAVNGLLNRENGPGRASRARFPRSLLADNRRVMLRLGSKGLSYGPPREIPLQTFRESNVR